jgi:5-oxoprolinase (ATP-hydrolysing)
MRQTGREWRLWQQVGALGAEAVEQQGAVTPMRGGDTADLVPGEVFVIETPGGGGFQSPSP